MIAMMNTLARTARMSRVALVGLALSATAATAWAQAELPAAQAAVLKQALVKRIPDLGAIDGIRTTPIAGLFEFRMGTQVMYTDAKGDYIIEGHLVDTKTLRNLTQERIDDLSKIDFATLPLKDSIAWKNGNGKRKLVVFTDPQCGYCKQLEKRFSDVKDITVYSFVIGILGDESKRLADNIWCLGDRTNAWRDWMVSNKTPARTMGACSGTPLQRNMALARRLGVNGTPAMFFEDGTRLASAAPTDVIEERLAKASATVAAKSAK
jgi:thiol:disulfide interchange protein DsbC